MKKNLIFLLALLLVFAMAVTGCGAEKPVETTSVDTPETMPVLGLASWELSASTWSSPNGATVHLAATPNGYAEGQSARFVVRLEGEDVDSIPCQWNGSQYIAAADLNGADGYCYYVILTAADGSELEVAVNTPNAPMDDSLINMESALRAYCTLTVNESKQEGGKLTITDGNVTVQLPKITNHGESILCGSAKLVLVFDGEEVSTADIGLGDPVDGGMYDLSIVGATFQIPDMEDDQRVELRLDVTLTNDQKLSTIGGSWLYNNGQLLLAAG